MKELVERMMEYFMSTTTPDYSKVSGTPRPGCKVHVDFLEGVSAKGYLFCLPTQELDEGDAFVHISGEYLHLEDLTKLPNIKIITFI